MADELKAKGNSAFSSGDFQTAIKHFTEAIALDPKNHVLYSNRSASYASLNQYEEALADAKECVSLKPDWAKGYSRLGAAHYGLKQWDQAIAAYETGLQHDPSSEQMKSALADAQQAKSKPASPFAQPEMLVKLAADPRTRNLMGDPSFMKMLADFQANPAAMTMYMNDPKFQLLMEVAFGIRMAGPGDAMNEDKGQQEPKPEASSSSRGPSSEASRPTPASKAPEPPAASEEPLSEEEKAVAAKKKEADAEKELGNSAYKNKQFDAAVSHYNKALELYDGDISYLTNRAAVFYEMGQYVKCIEDCDKAVERGRELRADFKLLARAMTRKANALVKLDRLEEAVQVYNKSLTEHRNADTLKKLNDTEKMLKEQRERAYVDLAKCEEEREAGNQAFKDMKYPEAAQHYQEALKRGPPAYNPEAYKIYSNLAACYTKLGAYPEGVKAADKCIELNPKFAKGYSRKGTLQYFMKEYDKALETYSKGLEMEPDNQELKEGVDKCAEAIGRIASGHATPEELKERQARAMADPEIQSILKDPVMQQVLRDFQEDPKSAQHHLRNAGIMGKINKLVAAGIIQVR